MPNITYFLGAGASAQALPLMKSSKNPTIPGLPEELNTFVANYKRSALCNAEIVDDLEYITKKSIEFGSPDLFAKFLLETGDDGNYQLLKNLVSNYFTEKQELAFTGEARDQGYFDKRTLPFLTTIAQNRKIPNNIKIISWNYDRQIEIAANKLKPVKSGVFKKIKGFTCWPNYEESYDYDKRHQYKNDDIFLIHVNGIAGYRYSKMVLAERSNSIYNFEEKDETLLSFAWENEKTDSKKTFFAQRMIHAQRIAQKTEILVIIGYSFPFFNRKLDDELFKAMKKTLSKIYVQDPIDITGNLRNQFDLSDKVSSSIIHVSEKDNYHIPFEL